MIHFVYKWHYTLSIFLSPIHFPVHRVNDILQFPLTPGCLCALSRGSWGGFFVAVAVATVVICSSNLKGPEDWTGELLYWHNSPFHTGTVGSLCEGALELKHHALRICTPSSHSFFFKREERRAWRKQPIFRGQKATQTRKIMWSVIETRDV